MRKGGAVNTAEDDLIGILKDFLILQLGLAGVPQIEIRKIVGCDIHRVNRIVKHLKRKTKETAGNQR